MDGRRKIRFAGIIALCILWGAAFSARADSAHKIEQVFINMPDVTTYYRSPSEENELEAFLDGEPLSLTDNQRFSETGEPVEYYVLLDISASIRQTRFEDIKASLTQFMNGLRETDSLKLLTFGDAVTAVLDGSEKREDAAATISQLVNHDNNTVFFDAIDNVTNLIEEEASRSQTRRIVVIVSDGKDCSDNTRSMESVETNLSAKGIPVYTVAVENNEGDSETEITSYQGKFSALARNTGGIPWTPASTEASTLDAFQKISETVMGSYRASFRASSNKVSNRTEEFVFRFLGPVEVTDTYSVLVSRNQRDDIAPEVQVTAGEQPNELKVSYSEPVENAETTGNYELRKNGKVIPVRQVIPHAEEQNTVRLIFDTDLYNGSYQLSIFHVTDRSNEQNALQTTEMDLQITENEDEPSTETEAPTEEPTEAPTEPPTEPQTEPETEPEEPDYLDIFLKWWPIVLTLIVIILAIIVFLITRKLRKKKGLTVIDGQVIDTGDVSEKLHVVPARQSERPQKNLVLWLSNGTAEPKRMEYMVDGSAIVGRSTQCDICCDDPMMSRQHFVIEVDDGNVYVSDLDTKNGTCVNGVKINGKYKIDPYDEIIAGSIKFRIEW